MKLSENQPKALAYDWQYVKKHKVDILNTQLINYMF